MLLFPATEVAERLAPQRLPQGGDMFATAGPLAAIGGVGAVAVPLAPAGVHVDVVDGAVSLGEGVAVDHGLGRRGGQLADVADQVRHVVDQQDAGLACGEHLAAADGGPEEAAGDVNGLERLAGTGYTL